ncbi:MAG: alpha-isopropylmalate synthase regulatory domain-containing protein [Ruminococcus sp.]
MKTVRIADVTLKEGTIAQGASLSFKEKIEIAKLLDKIKVDVIEMPAIQSEAADTLLLKTLSSLLLNSTISVDAGHSKETADKAYSAVAGAKKARMRVSLPTSTVQMEYICHQKPKKVIELIEELVSYCASLGTDVEFSAEDATRSEREFLSQAVATAIKAGAKTVTLCDTAAQMLPDEYKTLIENLYSDVPELKGIDLAVSCSSELAISTVCALTAVQCGAVEVKAAVAKTKLPSLENFVSLIRARGESVGVCTTVSVTELNRTVSQIKTLAKTRRTDTTPFDNKLGSEPDVDIKLDESSDISKVSKAIGALGYTLSDDDTAKVYESFKNTAKRKPVGAKELDAIVATEALQVPPTYKLVSFVINSGNIISPTANIVVEKQGVSLTGLSCGDGPIDAALLALEQIVGHHYELDDFQIQAVTEGREAMGEALIKLRADGALYSGRGISTDIIGATIRAYINALNKIVYGEN